MLEWLLLENASELEHVSCELVLCVYDTEVVFWEIENPENDCELLVEDDDILASIRLDRFIPLSVTLSYIDCCRWVRFCGNGGGGFSPFWLVNFAIPLVISSIFDVNSLIWSIVPSDCEALLLIDVHFCIPLIPDSECTLEKLFVRLSRKLALCIKSSEDWLSPDPMLLTGDRLKGETLNGEFELSIIL
jgi:hypothetical protein